MSFQTQRNSKSKRNELEKIGINLNNCSEEYNFHDLDS